ncbi:MAG: hypothetical protein ACLP50_20900 [Solirubrobacteraceae bacterium]
MPYDEKVTVKLDDLLHVAAALQIQIVRDLSPLWGVSGVVAAFTDLTQVPPGYVPLALVPTGTIPLHRYGFHFVAGGRPAALIECREDWSLLASHELMELLCDPWGSRTAPGRSLGDQKQELTSETSVVEGVDGQVRYQDQGQVEYLVEVCDPCQHSTYTINGVLLSDFVTPQYYEPFKTGGARYSFAGRVKAPFQLLDGGYITWRISAPQSEIWQAFAPSYKSAQPNDYPKIAEPQALKIGRLFPAAFSRAFIDSNGAKNLPRLRGDLSADRQPLADAQNAYRLARTSAQAYGKTLKSEIEGLLKSSRPTPNLDRTRELLERLTTPEGQKDFLSDPEAELKKCGIEMPASVGTPRTLPSVDHYRQAINAIDASAGFGPVFDQLDQPGLASWLCYLGGF